MAAAPVHQKVLDPEIIQLMGDLQSGQAIRTDCQFFIDANQHLAAMGSLLSQFINSLNDLVKNNIEFLYKDQFKQVLQILMSAFEKEETNSLLLLSRNK